MKVPAVTIPSGLNREGTDSVNEYDERLQQVVERTLSAKFSLWAALLTAHTVVLSVSVALVSSEHTRASFFRLCGFVATCCVIAVLVNFWLTKSQYEQIGRRTADPKGPLPAEERERDLRHAKIRRSLSSVLEIPALLGLLVVAVLFGWVLAAS